MFLFRRNKKDGEETPKCEQKFKSAYKSWKSDWRYEERNSRGTLQRVDVQNKQVNPFLELEARGFAILQRRRRLKQSLGDEEDPAVPEKRPPGYITQTQREDFQRAVRELMVDYWKNAAALRKMQESWQREYGLEKLQLLRAHKDRHGRLYAWVWDQEKCADLGGCCEPCFRELPSGSAESLSPLSPFSGYAGAIFPASFSGHKATYEPVTSGFAASALRSKHVKGPIKDPKA
ncbi:hypothetical protein CNMCM5878_001092 [Aspergillus fumigatiaffinis]|nr:hypothetical protein CNMCM5878_001092 [Aspergillus fumigatiaffinis]